MKKNLFLTFCFSFIPGAGQMYQNYMKRGLSLMCLGGLLFAMSVLLNTVIFIVPFLIIIAYSFFDTYTVRNSIGTDHEIKDEYMFKEIKINEIKRNRILGIGILLIGIYIIFNNIIARAFGDIEFVGAAIKIIKNYLPSIIVSAITIGVGIKMIAGKKDK